ncbi:MAG TPA: zinc-binding alcohol dehydrogenase family protein, partial [Candidatus Acidoferrales bacterium]|nr:zinc-binding alcohol dehydrogenase family protein [Candidatus Acidoferrales bacterium]
RPSYGSTAERTVVSRARCFAIPDNVNDDIAAAMVNPGLSAWSALVRRAQLAAGETVLILGATGVTGKLAIQMAKLLGAGRVIAAGRNEQVLNTLHDLGADSTIHLGKPGQDLTEAFVHEAGDSFDVIIDYLWGPTTEALLAAIARRDLRAASSRVRLVEVGEGAGPTISLAAAVLRSSRLEILGAGSGSAAASPEMWIEAVRQLMSNVGCGKLRIDTERVPLSEVENAWHQEQHGRRAVIIP